MAKSGLNAAEIAPTGEKPPLAAVVCEVARVASYMAETATAEWSTSITLPRGFLSREVVEVVVGIRRVEIPGELVRINLNIPDGIPLAHRLRSLLRQQLPPRIEGVGHVRAEDSLKGVIIVRTDHGNVDDSHDFRS